MSSKKQMKTVIKKEKRNRRKRNNNISPDRVERLRVVRVHDIMPPRILTTLKYLVGRQLVNNGGTTASIQLNANGIFDVDPAVASTSVAGFTEFMGFYRRFRVLKVRSVCTFINNESFPLVINLGFEPTFYAANGKTIGFYEGSHQKTKLVPRTQTAAGITLSMTKTGIEVVGDPIVQFELNYTGNSGANPNALWYTSVSVSSANLGLPLTLNGVSIRWETHFFVEFFERVNLESV